MLPLKPLRYAISHRSKYVPIAYPLSIGLSYPQLILNTQKTSPAPDDAPLDLLETRNFLEQSIPFLLKKPLPQDSLLDHVILRVCPITHPYLPTIKGKYTYNITQTMLRKVATNLLGPVSMHVISSTIEPPAQKVDLSRLSAEEIDYLERELVEKIPIFDDTSNKHAYSLFPWTYKLIMKWRTCTEQCKSEPPERVLSGIFVFELGLSNTKILVHNIEDLELVAKEEEVKAFPVA